MSSYTLIGQTAYRSVKKGVFPINTFPLCHTMAEIDELISANELSFLYVSQENCSVCHGLEPQIKQMLEKYPRIVAKKVDASEVPEVAGKFSVFTAPVLLLFVHG
ncbi:MAG TPA: thioredoxin family protein, partial [Pseudogracilibacillus sp.]|nr:thioredoxin family protein [Pseudogracilibacillus sp.]